MHTYACENYLADCDPNRSGYLHWLHFIRQWYLHGPVKMSDAAKAFTRGKQWDQVVDIEGLPGEADLQPKLGPIIDPGTMVESGIWMRWENQRLYENAPCRTPERISVGSMLHNWYVWRTKNFPGWMQPPLHIHLPIEFYSKEDFLCPVWNQFSGSDRVPTCPRCESILEGQPDICPQCRQRIGGYETYSAADYPRKSPKENLPDFPDDYSFYYAAAFVKALSDISTVNIHVSSDCNYKLWLNGSEIHRYTDGPRHVRWDSDAVFNVRLRDGWNLLLLKLIHINKGCDNAQFSLRMSQPQKKPINVYDYAGDADSLSPENQLKINVSDPISIGISNTYPRLRRFSNGTIVCNQYQSDNGGITWRDCVQLIGSYDEECTLWGDTERNSRWHNCDNAETLIFHESCRYVEPGKFKGWICRSRDGWKTRFAQEVTIRIPQGVNLVDERNKSIGAGVISGLNILSLPNGDLIVPMYGSLKEDVVWFDKRTVNGYLKYPQSWPNQYKYRSFLLRSQDGGSTWDYYSTIASFPELGDEGFCEPYLEFLQDGRLLAVMRNGGGPSTPLWVSYSSDHGVTWTLPVMTTLCGNYPSIKRLSNGVLACMYGRPYNNVSFDITGTGLSWSHNVVVYTGRGNDHIEAVETEPNRLFCVYEDDEFGHNDNRFATGSGKRQLYGVHVKVQKL